MTEQIVFPFLQDPLSTNDRFAQVCDALDESLLSREFLLTAKPDGRQIWKKDVGLFTLRVLYIRHWSERGTVHVDELTPHGLAGASTVFHHVYTAPQAERILAFIDSYE